MKYQALNLYQYISPLILTPLSFWLWWQTYEGDLWLTLFAWLLPIVYAYIVPAVGTNVLKVWEFDCRFRLGRFRPHHGFVFGSATSMIIWLVHPGVAQSWPDILITATLCALVLGIINTLYDINALRAGVLHVYNQPWADEKEAKAIALDYAPWFFGGFGFAYGLVLGTTEWLVGHSMLKTNTFIMLFILALVFIIAIPVLGYRTQSFKRHGHSGCSPISKEGHNARD